MLLLVGVVIRLSFRALVHPMLRSSRSHAAGVINVSIRADSSAGRPAARMRSGPGMPSGARRSSGGRGLVGSRAIRRLGAITACRVSGAGRRISEAWSAESARFGIRLRTAAERFTRAGCSDKQSIQLRFRRSGASVLGSARLPIRLRHGLAVAVAC